MRRILDGLILSLALVALTNFFNPVLAAQASVPTVAASSSNAPAPVDPNKAPSEFNHHMAGWALIGVGLLVLAGLLFPGLPLRYVWPALFLLAGLFLALWSDAEIWPRGNLSWAWLIHHDQEARQHKIYAVLLIGMGVVEYLRARGSLNRFWRAWAFPILAVIGACFLLVHDHTAASGASSPEAHAYLVNPALDQDGKPRPIPVSDPAPAMDHSTMTMDPSMAMDHMDPPMDHSAMPMADDPAPSDEHSDHHHHMTPSMLLVEREHLWFTIVGLGVALFKLISDGNFFRNRFVQYVWPSGMALLGVLLVLYHE